MKGTEQFIYLQLKVGVGMNLTLIPVIPPIHRVSDTRTSTLLGSVCHFVKHKYYRGEGRSQSNLFFRLPTVISYKLMARVVTAQTPSSIYKLTNETRRAHAHASRHIPITNSCHRLYMPNMFCFLYFE